MDSQHDCNRFVGGNELYPPAFFHFPCAIPITTFGIGLIYQKNQCLSSTAQPVSENHQQLSSFSPVNPRSIFPFPLSSENKTQLVYPGE